MLNFCSHRFFLTAVFAFGFLPAVGISQVTVSELLTEYGPAVVNIYSEIQSKDGQRERSGPSGSGFIVSNLGYVMTVAHVLPEPSNDEIAIIYGRVRFSQAQPFRMQVIDLNTNLDLALLKLPSLDESWPAVVIGDSQNVEVGAELTALGFPLNLELSPAEGLLSNRDGPDGTWQTTLGINRGNSGGPVFSNASGKVVGIAKAGYDYAQNITFAIPSAHAALMLDPVGELPTQTVFEPAFQCDALQDMRSLGWSSGNKTEFCQARGFDGIHNPWGEYKAGGY